MLLYRSRVTIFIYNKQYASTWISYSSISLNHNIFVYLLEDGNWSSSIDPSFNANETNFGSSYVTFISTGKKSCLGINVQGRAYPLWSIAISPQRPALTRFETMIRIMVLYKDKRQRFYFNYEL